MNNHCLIWKHVIHRSQRRNKATVGVVTDRCSVRARRRCPSQSAPVLPVCPAYKAARWWSCSCSRRASRNTARARYTRSRNPSPANRPTTSACETIQRCTATFQRGAGVKSLHQAARTRKPLNYICDTKVYAILVIWRAQRAAVCYHTVLIDLEIQPVKYHLPEIYNIFHVNPFCENNFRVYILFCFRESTMAWELFLEFEAQRHRDTNEWTSGVAAWLRWNGNWYTTKL